MEPRRAGPVLVFVGDLTCRHPEGIDHRPGERRTIGWRGAHARRQRDALATKDALCRAAVEPVERRDVPVAGLGLLMRRQLHRHEVSPFMAVLVT